MAEYKIPQMHVLSMASHHQQLPLPTKSPTYSGQSKRRFLDFTNLKLILNEVAHPLYSRIEICGFSLMLFCLTYKSSVTQTSFRFGNVN